MMKRRFKNLLLFAAAVCCWHGASAQHTLGFTAGYGMASARFDPKQEMKGMWGIYTAGLTWRYYGTQRFVGGFGIDLEFLQQGFSFATNASLVEEPKDFRYYTRHINSVMLPIVWQPHIYMLRHRVRVYLEAAATFSYQLSSDYEDESAKASGMADWKGDYNYKTARDSRWGYGLAGGGGIAFLIRRFEINVRARYYFGLSDVVRNRNKYADNGIDGSENPFWTTPMRSPLDNLTISGGVELPLQQGGLLDLETASQTRKEPRSLQIRIINIQAMETTRQQKIAKQIQKDVAEIFQKEGAGIVRGALVTVTAVRISPDFGYAKVYVSIFPFDRSAATMKEIEHQNWFIRRALGQRIRNQVKNVPELQFFLDDSLEYIEHIEEALKHDKPE